MTDASSTAPGDARMRLAFERASVGLATVGLDGRFLEVNDALTRLTGYGRDELLARTFGDITHPDDLEADWALAEKLVAGEIPSYAMDKRYLRKDGAIVWVRLHRSLAHDPDTGAAFYVAVVEDISAAKAAERETARLLQLVEHSTDFIGTTDLEGRLTYLNPGGRRMIGLAPDADVRQIRFTDYVPPSWQDFFRDVVAKTARTKGLWEGEMQLRHLVTGRLIDVQRSAFLLRDPDTGAPWGYATVTRDVTEQNFARRALEDADRRLRAALTASDVGMWSWDPNRDEVVGDANLLRLFGVSTQGPTTPLAPYLARIHPEDRPRVEAAIAAVLACGGVYDELYRVLRTDGGYRWLHARGHVELDPAGKTLHFPGIAVDVTRSVEMTRQLRDTADRYRALLSSTEGGFGVLEVVLDDTGRAVDLRVLEANASFLHQIGHGPRMVGRRIREFEPEFDDTWVQTYAEVARTGEHVRFEHLDLKRQRWFEVEALQVGEPDLRRVAVFVRDVTERHETESSLRRSEAEARRSEQFAFRVFDNLFAFVGVLDPDGTLVYTNAAPLEAAGLQLDAVRGQKFWDTPWWSYDTSVAEGLRDACARAAAGESVRYDVTVWMTDERRVTLDFQVAPLRDEQGRVTHLIPSAVDITERVRTEEALRESEIRFKRLFDTNLLGIVVWHDDGRLLESNDAFLDTVGYDRADLEAGRLNWTDLTPTEHVGQDQRTLEELRATGKHHPIEKEYWRKDGSRVWVVIGSVTLHRDSGVSFVLDISPQKRVEAALKESEQRAHEAARRAESERATLDAILEAAQAGIILADADGRLLRSNKANERLWGPTPPTSSVADYGAWKGWWADRSERHGQLIAPDQWAMARALRGETVIEDIVEIEPFDRPGTRRTMVNSGAPVRDAEGHVLGAVIAQMDISALVAAEAARRESEQRFLAVADRIPQLAWIADAEGNLNWYNQRWFEYTGTTLDEMLGWGWRKVHHPDHVARVEAKFRAHLASGEPWEDTFPIRGRDGSYRWFLSRAFPLRDDDGRVVQWFGTNTDVTAQRQAEEALREADRRKDEFIAILAHELRNPLAPVRNAVQILRRVGPQEPRLQRAQEMIDRQVAHMTRLIDDLLDVSRISRGKLALRRERCDLAEVARQTAEDYRASLEELGLTLVITSPGPLEVEGDPVRLAQMVGNLLQNAGRFTERGGRVEVRAERVDEEAAVRVIDTGVGIEPDLLHRLFDPFSQADQDLARSKGGLGLGLALTKGLAELHGGTVTVASAGKGRGSTFTILLPVAPTREAAMTDADPTRPHPGGLRIVVIEDNRDLAESMAELLQLDGHEVEIAYDGASGVAATRAFHPHVVISDLGLPGGLDGYGVAQALRADPATAGLALVALSGYADEGALKRSREAGFDRHLAKPVDIDKLERTLEELGGR